MKRHLQCAEPQVSRSNLTKCCACHAERLTCLILITYQTSFTMRGATGVTLQPHQMLRLPRKMTLQDVKENLQKQVKRHFQCGADPTMIRAWSENDPRMIRAWKRKPQPASQVRLLCEVPRSIFYCKIQHFAPNLTLKLSPNTAPATKSATWTSPSTAPATKSDTWTSPSTAPATKNDSTAVSSSHMKRHFQCAEQQVSLSNLPKYCTCHEKLTLQDVKENLQKQVKRHFQRGADPTMIRAWSEHDPRMIRAWKRKPQPASQVRLLCEVPRSIFYCKIQRFAPNLTLKLSLNTAPATKSATWTSPSTAPATKSDTWTSPSTAPATKSDTWTSPSTAPATKNDSTAVSSSHMKRHFQCAEQQVSLSNLPKYCTCHEKWHCKMSKKISKNRWNVISNAGPIRPWSEHDPSMIREWSEHENANRNPPRKWGYFARSPEAFSIVKYNVLHPILHSNFHQILRLPRKAPLERHQVLHLPRKVTLELHQVLRLPRKVTLELHQVLRLPRKMTRLLYRPHIWNVISNARSNRCHYPTSPNTAPATKNNTARCQRKSPKTGETSFPMRGRSDHDPSMIRAWSENDPRMIRAWKRKPQPASQVRLLCELPRSIFYCKIQRFAPNLTFKPSPNTAPATKSATWTSPNTAPATKSDTWTSPSTAPATKSDTWTSPSTAPATKSDTWTSPSTAPATVL